MITRPLAVLDEDDIRELLIAIGADPDTKGLEQKWFETMMRRSRKGARIVAELQEVLREAENATQAMGLGRQRR